MRKPDIQKILPVIVCCFLSAALLSQPNITRVEYFFNTDPGFGNGSSISITPAANITDKTVSLPIGGLSNGLNTLFIRSRDANGKWSITNRFLFVLISPLATPPNITKAEYFIDTDPGFGNGSNISLTSAPDVMDKSFPVSLTSLTDGLHTLFVRSRDANGRWSVTNRFLFVKLSASTTPPDIVRAEYFLDSDPGFGNGTSIPITPAANLQDVAAGINIAGLQEGLHWLYLRTKDAGGKWSLTNRWLFVKIAAGTPDITNVEYFIDTDPGFGKGVPVAINDAPNISDYVTPVNITGLSVANHYLFLRTKNAAGKWSVTAKTAFQTSATVAAPAINVNGLTQKTLCGDHSFKLSFHATGTYVSGNTFTVELSNSAGSFASPTPIGSVSATTSSIVNCTIPLHITNGNNYKVRVVSSNPVVTGATADTVFSLFNQPRFSDTTVVIICQNETVNLTTVYNTAGFTTLWNTASPQVAPAGNYQLITSNTALCKDTATVIVKQDVATWLGTTSKNWHTAANWSTGKVPSEKTHVIIPNGTPNNCELSASDVTISSLQVRPGAIMNVINSRLVTITARCNPLP